MDGKTPQRIHVLQELHEIAMVRYNALKKTSKTKTTEKALLFCQAVYRLLHGPEEEAPLPLRPKPIFEYGPERKRVLQLLEQLRGDVPKPLHKKRGAAAMAGPERGKSRRKRKSFF